MRYLVTGTAGFIGFHLAKKLLDLGNEVLGIDNLNSYYSIELKQARHNILKQYSNFTEAVLDLCDLEALSTCIDKYAPERICHLAAQAGVFYSLKNPLAYKHSNLEAFCNIIELAHQRNIKKFVYASSSSIYGDSNNIPYKESQIVDQPISLYAATKRCNELIAYTYSHNYDMQTIGLRFFTVYGPWGRPDMALWKFTDAIYEGKELTLYNYGHNYRDFTYIDDIIQGLYAVLTKNIPERYEIFNLGNHRSENIKMLVKYIEQYLHKQAIIELVPPQQGDVFQTYADISHAHEVLDYMPTTNIEQGTASFLQWYQEHESLVQPIRKQRYAIS